MPYILNIETATNVCSVAISNGNEIIFQKEETNGPSHATLLGVFVNEAVTFLRTKNKTLDAVAVSCGPGSYTGLRIGISEAKGICFGFNIPLIAINTPLIMAKRVLAENNIDKDVILCPMIDARRMEVYAALYNQSLEEVRTTQADIVDESSYAEFLDKNTIMFFGNGADKCKSSITSSNAIFLDNIYPQATQMIELANDAYENKQFVDAAYFEPFYLKEFVATTPKNKVLS